MKRKWMSKHWPKVVLSSLLGLGLAGCGSQVTTESSGKTPTVTSQDYQKRYQPGANKQNPSNTSQQYQDRYRQR